jgi:asparagine synthase (glutamine-hydrolysing)
MCGFVGSVTFSGGLAPKVPAEIAKRIRWRGPDAFGEMGSADHSLASARLAVIDLDQEANQPMASPDGAWELVFNGEIYNYRQLALEHGLSDRARRSDSWTTLELIQRYGVNRAHHLLRGMYAFAALETSSTRLWLVRDPFGIKPLAWTQVGTAVLFGSDPRSLASWRIQIGAPNHLDDYSLTHFLMVGYVPGDSTAWNDIHRVEPGAVVTMDANGPTVDDWDPFGGGSDGQIVTPDDVDAALRASVARHLIADVEIGAFLSGGIDSSLITTIARHEFGSSMKTYSVGFDSHDVPDETVAAQRMAKAINTKHTTLTLREGDFCGLAQSVAEAFPEPHADPAAMPMWALSQRAREDVKVVLTGEGGDEMFGGYRRYWSLPLARTAVGRIAGRIGLAAVARGIGNRRLRQVADSASGATGGAFLRYLTQRHWDQVTPVSAMCSTETVARVIDRYEINRGGETTPASMRYLELRRHLPETYLEKDDRTTMRHGLEARVPFLDLDLAAVALKLDGGMLARPGKTKVLLRKVAARYLPAGTAHAPKRGFTVPLKSWMSPARTTEWIRESLLDGQAVARGIFDVRALPNVVAGLSNVEGAGNAEALYRLLMLELWCRDAAKDGAL